MLNMKKIFIAGTVMTALCATAFAATNDQADKPTMKYFCTTETIALYIQKYAHYRKRKVFFGETGKINDLIPAMLKHSEEKFLVPQQANNHNESITTTSQ